MYKTNVNKDEKNVYIMQGRDSLQEHYLRNHFHPPWYMHILFPAVSECISVHFKFLFTSYTLIKLPEQLLKHVYLSICINSTYTYCQKGVIVTQLTCKRHVVEYPQNSLYSQGHIVSQRLGT